MRVGLGRDNGASSGHPGRALKNRRIVLPKNALGPVAAPGGSPSRRVLGGPGASPCLPLLLLALLGACAYLPTASPRGGTSAPPVPDLLKRYPWMADTRWPAGVPRPSEREELAIAGDIDQLLTGDFDVYPVAARRLILRGSIVLPCLGQAAERNPAPLNRKGRLSIVLGPVLRDASEERVLLALSSPYATVRAAAAVATGERGIRSLGPRLVALLEDRDILVRRAAIMSLRMLTGEFLDYKADDPPAERAAAADRWDELWQRRQ